MYEQKKLPKKKEIEKGILKQQNHLHKFNPIERQITISHITITEYKPKRTKQ